MLGEGPEDAGNTHRGHARRDIRVAMLPESECSVAHRPRRTRSQPFYSFPARPAVKSSHRRSAGRCMIAWACHRLCPVHLRGRTIGRTVRVDLSLTVRSTSTATIYFVASNHLLPHSESIHCTPRNPNEIYPCTRNSGGCMLLVFQSIPR